MTNSRPVRLVHLFGGLRAVCNPNGEVTLMPSVPPKGMATFLTTAYEATYSEIEHVTGNKFIGVEFWSRLDGDRRHEEWFLRADWPGASGNHADAWGGIAHAAAAHDLEMSFNARCIKAQLWATYATVKSLSDAYYTALEYHSIEGEKSRFASTRTQQIHFTNQLVLFTITSTLDFIFRFAARHILGMKESADNFSRTADDILAGGIITNEERVELEGLYNIRNLAMHNAPLSIIGSFAASLSLGLKGFPSLTVEVPKPTEKAVDFRKQLYDLKTFGDWQEFDSNQTNRVDVLNFAVTAVQLTTAISKRVVAQCPVEPKMPTVSFEPT